MEVDHDRQVVHTETLGLALHEPEALLAAMRPSEEHVASRLTSPIVSTHLDTRNVAFERSVGARPRCGWCPPGPWFGPLGGRAAHRGCSDGGGGHCGPSSSLGSPLATSGGEVRGPQCLDFWPHVFSHNRKDLGCGSGRLFAPVLVSPRYGRFWARVLCGWWPRNLTLLARLFCLTTYAPVPGTDF